MNKWHAFPNAVGDWIRIKVWHCGCIHTVISLEVHEEELYYWEKEYEPEDGTYYTLIYLPPRQDGVQPCRKWREELLAETEVEALERLEAENRALREQLELWKNLQAE